MYLNNYGSKSYTLYSVAHMVKHKIKLVLLLLMWVPHYDLADSSQEI